MSKPAQRFRSLKGYCPFHLPLDVLSGQRASVLGANKRHMLAPRYSPIVFRAYGPYLDSKIQAERINRHGQSASVFWARSGRASSYVEGSLLLRPPVAPESISEGGHGGLGATFPGRVLRLADSKHYHLSRKTGWMRLEPRS